MRLGRHGIDEIKAHPFLAGIDWTKLQVRMEMWWCYSTANASSSVQAQDAPYVPPAGRTIGALIDRLSKLPRLRMYDQRGGNSVVIHPPCLLVPLRTTPPLQRPSKNPYAPKPSLASLQGQTLPAHAPLDEQRPQHIGLLH